MLIDAQELPTMAFCGPRYDEDKFESVVDYECRQLKPRCGFWASPILDSGITAWEQWCKDNEYTHHNGSKGTETRQTVVVSDTARVFMVSDRWDMDYLNVNYDWQWREIAEDYDAVFVEGEGVWAMSRGSWDLDSILFFNTDCFTVQSDNSLQSVV